MDYKVTHFDDGEGKRLSHKVEITLEGGSRDLFEEASVIAYGSTKDEAYEKCMERFKQSCERINNCLQEILNEFKKEDIVEVDWLGNEQ